MPVLKTIYYRRREMQEQELCCLCGEPTNKAGEDSLFVNGVGPYCEACFDVVHETKQLSSK
jgi:hypothetical protein